MSTESDAEVRRVSISNTGSRVRHIELTSYAEIVLAPPAADTAHPAFSKLFVQTEFVAVHRRAARDPPARSPTEPEIWAAHLRGRRKANPSASSQFETDRARFIGRAASSRRALAVTEARRSPAPSARCSIQSSVCGAACESRRGNRPRRLLDHDRRIARRGVGSGGQASGCGRLRARANARVDASAGSAAAPRGRRSRRRACSSGSRAMFFTADPTLRPSSDALPRGGGGPSALWAHGISGDLPIVVVRIDDTDELDVLRQCCGAFEYWRLKRLAVDLVILNERAPSYLQDLQAALETLIRTGPSQPRSAGQAAQGGVFLLRADLISSDARDAAADRSAGGAAQPPRQPGGATRAARRERDAGAAAAAAPAASLHVPAGPPPPHTDAGVLQRLRRLRRRRPRVRDLAARRPMHAGAVDQRHRQSQFRLSGLRGRRGIPGQATAATISSRPWSNDPVGDRPGEVLYLRDEDSGELWGPTALPIRQPTVHLRRAARAAATAASSTTQHGIALELLQFVPLDAPIKISRLTIRNRLRPYQAPVADRLRRMGARYLAQRYGALYLDRNRRRDRRHARAQPLERASQSRVAFVGPGRTANLLDRRSTRIPRPQRHTGAPAALIRAAAAVRRVGAGLDPCGALQTSFELAADASRRDRLVARRDGHDARRHRPRSRTGAAPILQRRWQTVRAHLGPGPGRGGGQDAGPIASTSC